MRIPLRDRPFQRILLIKPSSLGDVIHALPVLHGLRRRYPTAKIDWLINPAFAPLLSGHPDLNEAILFDRKKYGRMLFDWSGAKDFLRFVRGLQAKKYDLAIDLQGLLRSGFIARVSGARTRIGFRGAREGAHFFYTDLIEPPDSMEHAADRNYFVMQMLGAESFGLSFQLPIGEHAGTKATELLSASRIGDEAVVLVAPGARWETKCWAAERFATVIDQIHEQTAARCVLVGGTDELPLCEAVARACRGNIVNLAGKTDLPTLAALIERCALLICHDSGPMHLAAALNRPLVCITGPTNPKRTGPYARGGDVIRVDLACSPCYLRKLSACPHEHRCMADVRVDAVFQAVLERLDKSGLRVDRYEQSIRVQLS